MTEYPKIIAVIPAYNSAGFIEKSLQSLLIQDYPLSRKIVIDDCSPDNTYDLVVSKYGNQLEIMKNEHNSGFAFSLNRAISIAEDADFLFVLEDDIELTAPTYITQALKHFTDDRLAGVCGQAIGFERERLSLVKRCFSRFINADFQDTGVKEVSYSLLKSDLLRISALKEVGGFGFAGNPKLGVEDQIFSKKIREHGFMLLKDASLKYRLEFARKNSISDLFKSERNAGLTLGVAVSQGVISLKHKGTENVVRFNQRARMVIFTTLFFLSFLLFIYSTPLATAFILGLLVLEWLIYISKSHNFQSWEKLFFASLGVVNDFVFSIPFYYGFVLGIIKRFWR